MGRTGTRAFPNSPHAIRKSKDETFRFLITNAKYEKKIKKNQIATAMNCTPQTLRNRLEKPESLTLAELRKIAELLGWTAEELAQII